MHKVREFKKTGAIMIYLTVNTSKLGMSPSNSTVL